MITLAPHPPAPRPGAVRQALEEALRQLDGAPPDLVLVNDPQRATDSPAVLAVARDYFDVTRTRLLVAAGSHRFTETEKAAFQQAFPAVPAPNWAWHDDGTPDLIPIGGPAGWRAHPWLARARHVLAIGSVEPHYFAGFGGAHKTLTIGCAARADIERNHAHAMEPACRPGRLDGNPVHAGICAMLARLGNERRLAAVNLVQSGATVVEAAGGAPLDALDALAPVVSAAWLHTILRPADALVAEVTGPLAVSFYQAEKGIKNSEWAVRDGGAIILCAACPRGIGQDAFVRLLREAPNHAAAVERVRRQGYRLGDHKAVRLRFLTDPACRNVRLFAVAPGLSEADAAVLGVTRAESVAAALRLAGVDPAGPGVYRVEDAGSTCVRTA